MLVYLFNPETKEFTDSKKARKNPVNPETFLKPQNSTFKPVPHTRKKNVCFLYDVKKDEWELRPDFRNAECFITTTKEPVKIDYIGPLKSYHTNARPPLKFSEYFDFNSESKKWIFDSKYHNDLIKKLEEIFYENCTKKTTDLLQYIINEKKYFFKIDNVFLLDMACMIKSKELQHEYFAFNEKGHLCEIIITKEDLEEISNKYFARRKEELVILKSKIISLRGTGSTDLLEILEKEV